LLSWASAAETTEEKHCLSRIKKIARKGRVVRGSEIRTLIEYIRKPVTDRVRVESMRALAKNPNPQVTDALLGLATDKSASNESRSNATNVLETQRNLLDKTVIERLLRSDEVGEAVFIRTMVYIAPYVVLTPDEIDGLLDLYDGGGRNNNDKNVAIVLFAETYLGLCRDRTTAPWAATGSRSRRRLRVGVR